MSKQSPRVYEVWGVCMKNNTMTAGAFFLLAGVLAAAWAGKHIALIGILLSIGFYCTACIDWKAAKPVFLAGLILMAGLLNYGFHSDRANGFDKLEGEFVELDCVIVEEPLIKESSTRYTVECKAIGVGSAIKTSKAKLYIRTKGNEGFVFGDRIKASGLVKKTAVLRNFGDFDYELYNKSRGIKALIEVQSAELLEHNCSSVWRKLLYQSKSGLRAVLYRVLPQAEASILFGILTGDKSDMDEDIRQAYKKAGLSHILSVSGMHIGFVVVLIGFAVKPFKLNVKSEAFVTLALIAFYVLLIGAPAPAVRTALMLLVLFLGKASGRKYDLGSSVSFALFAMIAVRPYYIHDPGFVISFGCMYSIAFLYQSIYKSLRVIPRILRASLALSISVALGITPLLASYFNYVSFMGLVLNAAAIPLAFAITTFGFVGIVLGLGSPLASMLVLSVPYYLIRVLNLLAEAAAGFKYGGIYIPAVPMYIYMVYYVLLILSFRCFGSRYYKAYREKCWYGAMAAAVIAVSIYIIPLGNLEVTFVDVGQGDSICIKTPGKKVFVVDGGGSAGGTKNAFDVGSQITVPALWKLGAWAIEAVLVTHSHGDHVEGLIGVVERFPVKRVLMPRLDYESYPQLTSEPLEKLVRLCQEKRIPLIQLSKGDQVRLDRDVVIKVLHPESSIITGTSSDSNNNSLVFRLEHKRVSILFTGDIEEEAEGVLYDMELYSDVLKVAHHGSRTSSGERFLKQVQPKYSIISVGKNNYGHPCQTTLNRIADSGSGMGRTDKNGAIRLLSNGRRFKIVTVR